VRKEGQRVEWKEWERERERGSCFVDGKHDRASTGNKSETIQARKHRNLFSQHYFLSSLQSLLNKVASSNNNLHLAFPREFLCSYMNKMHRDAVSNGQPLNDHQAAIASAQAQTLKSRRTRSFNKKAEKRSHCPDKDVTRNFL